MGLIAGGVCSSCNIDEYITDGKDYSTTYYRPATLASNPYCTKVFEYTPAPGQFINETKTGGFDGTQTTAEAACAYAEARFAADIWVSMAWKKTGRINTAGMKKIPCRATELKVAGSV